ncbi:dynein light chain type 1 [Opisthorchis viverrini]|uniref:Dynein light chain type 1 n=2 Tax=Opisthorchis viverrini TaxID=6198 RepID=A0A1S8X5Z0_OPIVI|nr:hypothetical protein T265_01531 [Opisthorchis viverrini]KER32486.1 hypothetical protein T265_01531 [Opisthorchis viverrini]OON21883.1 dynein light chain type 1 [Opisthorchis viverrini]
MSEQNATVKVCDMNEQKKSKVVQLAQEAVSRFNSSKEIAGYLKTKLEEAYEGNWHCIVGRDFGSKISQEEGNFIFFYIGDRAFQMYKFG